MHRNTKIATCCYCGARAALILEAGRHELMCSSCGADLHNLKNLPIKKSDAPDWRLASGPSAPGGGFGSGGGAMARPGKKKKKKKKKAKGFFKDLFDEIEDIFD